MKSDGSVKYASADEPRQQGFALIELMVVLMVLAIALSIAVPSFTGSIERSRSDSALQQVEEAMQIARLEAISKNTPYSIQPLVAGDGWQSGMVVRRGSAGAVLREYEPFAGAVSIDVQEAGLDVGQVMFNGLGGLEDASAPVIVSIAAGDASRSLNISPSGRILRQGGN